MDKPYRKWEREGVYKVHFEKFGCDPVICGIYWNDNLTLEKMIQKAIDENVKAFKKARK